MVYSSHCSAVSWSHPQQEEAAVPPPRASAYRSATNQHSSGQLRTPGLDLAQLIVLEHVKSWWCPARAGDGQAPVHLDVEENITAFMFPLLRRCTSKDFLCAWFLRRVIFAGKCWPFALLGVTVFPAWPYVLAELGQVAQPQLGTHACSRAVSESWGAHEGWRWLLCCMAMLQVAGT